MPNKLRVREERRILPASELRAVKTDRGVRVEGYAAIYDAWSEDLGGFRERIAKGFFGPMIERSDVRFLINHDGLPLARRRGVAGDTLELEDRDKGLWIGTDLNLDDPDVQRLAPKLERGDLDQMSFAFSLPAEGGDLWEGRDRTLVEGDRLFDVSPVTYPAYANTEVALRALARAAEPDTSAIERVATARAQWKHRERGWLTGQSVNP